MNASNPNDEPSSAELEKGNPPAVSSSKAISGLHAAGNLCSLEKLCKCFYINLCDILERARTDSSGSLMPRLCALGFMCIFVGSLLYSVLLLLRIDISWQGGLYLALCVTFAWGAFAGFTGIADWKTRTPSQAPEAPANTPTQVGATPSLPNRRASQYYGRRSDFQNIVKCVGAPRASRTPVE